MANPVVVLSFIWTYVVPIVRDAVKVLGKGTYHYIRDRVDDADILALAGFEKRTKVFADTIEWISKKNVDASLFSSALVYLLIEIAVVNMKKEQNKLLKRNS